MTETQIKIVRTLMWIFFPIAIWKLIYMVNRFSTQDSLQTDSTLTFMDKLDGAIGIVAIVLICIAVVALIQQFFSTGRGQTEEAKIASAAPVLITIKPARAFLVHLLFFVIALGFSVLLNVILLYPDLIVDQDHLESIQWFERVMFGIFYVIAHFLIIVSGLRLIKGMPPAFIATERGFLYNPSGISSGWILWEDVEEARETPLLAGTAWMSGPGILTVIGIKLKYPEKYNAAAFIPLLRSLVEKGQTLNNYQTEGVGDLFLEPVVLGKKYDEVKALFMKYTKRSIA